MNKTERPADELLTGAAKALEEAYYLLNDAADAQDFDRYMRQSIRIVRRIVSNARISVCDILKEMEDNE